MATSVTFTVDELPDCTVVHAAGDIDAGNRDELAEAITRGRRRGRPLILDFSAVTFLDSSGLHVLLNAHARAARGERDFHLAALHPRVARLFRITGVLRLLQVHASVEQARTAAVTSGQHMVES
ncbi:anti-sigma factor antagonist [Herbidospora sp. NEAU-GS84]|uniref:Anti-sigma factor antagonist n=1 Tax=Herbidospora solisilvae TaxID=2696284 RepID=A0A7C9NLK9_9ACTN|nr:STAS domain-containing protein [Herbidospora solisilvae]NAS26358.1 anti-sigma factor antagonist [Herbidospora solisilvae]